MTDPDLSPLLIAIVVGYIHALGHVWIHFHGPSNQLIKWLVDKKFWWDFKHLNKHVLVSRFSLSDSQSHLADERNLSPLKYPSAEALYIQEWQNLLAGAAGLSLASLAPLVVIWFFLAYNSVAAASIGGSSCLLVAGVAWDWVRKLPQ